MTSIVPYGYYPPDESESENRTYIIAINVGDGYVEFFLVQEHNRHINTFQSRFGTVHRLRLYPAAFTQILTCLYRIPRRRGLVCMKDPRLQLGSILYCLDYLRETSVPNTPDLNSLCVTLGRKSERIENLCQKISLDIKKRSNTIVDVWAAYMPDKENEITFMVITKKKCESPLIQDRPCLYRCIDDFSSEAAYVIKKEIPIPSLMRKKLRSAVNRHTGSLLRQHKNITLISISSLKSRNFKTRKELRPGPCIVIYVHVKGMIPIDEEALPTKLDGFDVDVREGAFSPFLHEPDQVSGSISMGCPIQGPGENVDEHGNVLGGTLGGFIDHPEFGLCCITSAHVVLSAKTMQTVNTSWQIPNTYTNTCYQPCPPHSFGRMVLAVCKEGDAYSSGVEVVMITVEERPPAYTGSHVLAYRSGDILERSDLLHQMENDNIEVIKYGAETGITKGKVHSEVTTINFINPDLCHNGLTFTLRNQIEIIGDGIFAKPGDSGAIVFHVAQNKHLKAIGILEGSTKGNTFIVTPICEILKSLGLPPPLHMKVFDHVPMATNEDYLEQRVESLEQTTENIKADVAVIKKEFEQQRQKLDEQGKKLDEQGEKLDSILKILTTPK